MKSRDLRWTPRNRMVVVLPALATLAIGVVGLPRALAADQSRLPAHFSGLLNDYTPATAGGPYEMHGKWSLNLSEERGSATFSAEMTMETADFANTDPDHDPTKLGAHTHHISVTDGVIHNDPTDPINWKTQCLAPAFKPPVSGGFVVTGTAYVTGNRGQPAVWQPVACDDLHPRRDAEPEPRGCPGVRRVLERHVDVRDGLACQHSFRNAGDQWSRR